MTFKDVCVKKTYEQNGEIKTKWLKVGTLKSLDNGKQFIELNIFPNQDFYVFEQKQDREYPEQSGHTEETPMNIPF